ncbi:hypothetical protein Ciccas_004820 [Cichlidogyrus casuarinus]|uniref:Uncharacterized protein n=1 Tax=Cichlidogyrus casuarinus TaxID=1844966 RepID=A0ABD2QAF1_9PLAT
MQNYFTYRRGIFADVLGYRPDNRGGIETVSDLSQVENSARGHHASVDGTAGQEKTLAPL